MGDAGVPDMGFIGSVDRYFVIEVPDGESLHAELSDYRAERVLEGAPAIAREGDPAREPGLYIHFRCASDERAHGYFFSRSVVNNRGPKEHAWIIEYTRRDGTVGQSRFRGTLHDYRRRKIPNKNRWAFLGTIRVPLPY